MERHLGIQDNFAFAEVAPEKLAGMIRAVAAQGPDAIGVICTNLRSASLVAALEAETGVPIYDTIATAVWKSLQLAGMDPVGVVGWGRIFRLYRDRRRRNAGDGSQSRRVELDPSPVAALLSVRTAIDIAPWPSSADPSRTTATG